MCILNLTRWIECHSLFHQLHRRHLFKQKNLVPTYESREVYSNLRLHLPQGSDFYFLLGMRVLACPHEVSQEAICSHLVVFGRTLTLLWQLFCIHFLGMFQLRTEAEEHDVVCPAQD